MGQSNHSVFDSPFEFDIELEIESYDDAEEMIVTKPDGYVYIELENIYFDLNKYDITPEAAKTLDVLVELLEKWSKNTLGADKYRCRCQFYLRIGK